MSTSKKIFLERSASELGTTMSALMRYGAALAAIKKSDPEKFHADLSNLRRHSNRLAVIAGRSAFIGSDRQDLREAAHAIREVSVRLLALTS